ncbi:MAG: glycosyltransferase [Treponema sp.]|nr:glycosyltransferase [Treponema sp.]
MDEIEINIPLISVIMLTYNREDLVSRAIESILKQTFKNFEFVIVDNGSTDKCGEIADEYAVKDERILVIHCNRGNIGSGRNTGLDMTTGEYITFIDDDDWCEPDYLDFLYKLSTENNADLAICGASDKYFDEKNVMTAEEAVIELLRRKKYNVAFPAKLFKASLFDNIRFSESAKYDDIELMPRIFGRTNKVAYYGLPKYTFYRHENNNSAWTTNHSLLDAAILDEYLTVYRNRTDWLCEQFPKSTAAWRYFGWSFMISMVEKINRFNISDCENQYNALRNELLENRNSFLKSNFLQEFERDWVEQYIK